MRAAVVKGSRLVLEDIPEPVAGAGQVLVRTLANGICGSDLHTLDPQQARRPRPPGPLVLGHEFCAEVVSYGGGASERPFAVGSAVCANPFVPGGLVNPGGLAEFMVLDIEQCFPVPESVPPTYAALTEPLAVGIRAVAVGEGLPGGAPYVVNGCGPIGLSVIAALRALGRGPIIATDLSPVRLSVAERLGVDEAVNASQDSFLDHLAPYGFTPAPMSAYVDRGRQAPLGLTIHECTGADGMLPRLIETAPRHSSIISVGIPVKPDALPSITALMSELSIGWALAYRREELELALSRIAAGSTDCAAFVTSTVPLDQAQAAVDALRDAKEVKVIVQPTL
jgi:threonine dehydrogenase-like Zn-dependent dehydrogenase